MTLLHCIVYTFFSQIIWKLTNKHQPLQIFQPHWWLSGSWAFGRFGHSNLRGLAPGRKIAMWKIECNGTRWIWGTGSTLKGLMLRCTWHGREVWGDRHRCFKTKSYGCSWRLDDLGYPHDSFSMIQRPWPKSPQFQSRQSRPLVVGVEYMFVHPCLS